MKKVGLITFHESDNYGTCLQAYALQRYIIDVGFECEIIDYRRKKIVEKKRTGILKRLCFVLREYGIVNFKYIKKANQYQNKQHEVFENFRRLEFKYSEERYSTFEELQAIDSDYCAFVVGSDMVWCKDRMDNADVYFLNFANKRKRIAYSPSFGSNGIPETYRQQYIEGLTELDFLSCREKSGVGLIKTLINKEVCYTVDPTLLIDKKIWEEMADKHTKKRYVLIYMFEGIPNWIKKKVQDVAEYYSAEIVQIPMGTRQWCEHAKNSGSTYGPKEFVSLFKNASFVFTNSYHGLLFSLIFEIPFFAVCRGNSRWGQFEDRLTDTLREYDCLDRYVTPDNIYSKGQYDMPFAYVTKRIAERRQLSAEYLNDALNKVMHNEGKPCENS